MRKSKAWHATREAQSAWELRGRFTELSEAAVAWRDHGDHDRLSLAIELLKDDAGYAGFPPLDEKKMSRDQRVAVLAERYVTVSRFGDRIRQVADQIDIQRQNIGDELRLVTAEQGSVSEYERGLLRHLRSEKIGQVDLHPVSRALGRAVAQTIREFNKERRAPKTSALPENYSDHPVSDWALLPAMFAGVELVERPIEKDRWSEPYPLPPSTDIATFTADRVRPPFGEDRFETVAMWAKIIQEWAARKNESVPGKQSAVWALLLAHRMPEDGADLSRLDGLEVWSPWRPGHIVRIDVLKVPDEPEDDVPFC